VIFLVYTPRGAGESAAEFFGQKGKVALLNPSLGEIRAVMNATGIKDLAVIRETGGSYPECSGVASIEKAVVDLYFETTRKKIPFLESEAGHIISGVIANAKIDIKTLLRAASRRGIRGEIKAILYTLRPELRLDNEPIKINEHAKTILQTTRGI
ncbi:MAG: DUF6577 family protein, partial [Candidatus Micrarchaeota archaeon]